MKYPVIPYFRDIEKREKVAKLVVLSQFSLCLWKIDYFACNLKKILALVLAFACAFTMFAGAAFTDQADIKVDAEVVDTLVSLGVINGYTDGSFKPNDTVTRAEMAKMIYVLRTGKSDASAYNNEKTTFTDINGHWAAGYVKYCQSLGIIAGQSATKFAPDQTVTAQEAAKMLLVTLGYDASKAGLVGASWASKTNALADENGLLKDVNTSFTGPCPRQYAAQLMYNAIFANTVVLRDGEYTKYGTNNSKNPTVGEKYMGLEEFTGIFNGNSDVDNTLKDGEISVGDHKATYEMNNDLIGEEVTVLYKDHKNGTDRELDTKDTVFGVYATGETTVYNITSGDLQNGDSDKIKFNDKQYKAETNINVSVNYVGSAASTARSVFQKNGTYYGDKADTIKFIAKDGKITTAYVNTYTLARVTAVNSDKVSINNGVGTVEFENNNIYNGIKKDDIVVVQTLYKTSADDDDARTTVTKADVQSGKLDGYKGTEKVTFGGKTYTVLDGKFAATTIDSDFETTVADQIGESYDFYFVGDYVAAVKMTSDGTKNYAVVMGFTGKADNKANPLKAAIKKADGSEVTAELDTDGITAYNGTSFSENDNNVYLIKYSETSSTKIKIKEAAKADTKAEGYNKDTKTFDKIVTSSDAPLFVKKGDDFYVYTLRNLNNTAAQSKSAKILDDGKVVAAYIDSDKTPSGASSDTVYGIVSKAKGSVKVDDTYYTEYAVDTFDKTGASETGKKILIEGTDATLSKGDLVSFDVASNDIYTDSDIHVYTDGKMDGKNNTNVKATWVKEYDAKGEILTTWNSIVKNSSGSFEGKKKADGTDDITVAAFDDDAVIAFVSVDDEKATTDNGVPAFDGVKGYKNVLVVTDGTKIVGLFVDTDNNIENLKSLSANNYQLAVAAPKATIAKGSNLNKDLSVEADKATAVAGNEIKYTVTIPAGTKAESSAKIVTIALPKDVTAKSGAEVAISGDNTNVTANGTTGFKISTTETTAETTVVFTVTVNSGVSAAIAAPTFTVA